MNKEFTIKSGFVDEKNVLVVPEGVEQVILIESNEDNNIEKVILPSTLKSFKIDIQSDDLTNLVRNRIYFEVSNENKDFFAKNGCLYQNCELWIQLVYYCEKNGYEELFEKCGRIEDNVLISIEYLNRFKTIPARVGSYSIYSVNLDEITINNGIQMLCKNFLYTNCVCKINIPDSVNSTLFNNTKYQFHISKDNPYFYIENNIVVQKINWEIDTEFYDVEKKQDAFGNIIKRYISKEDGTVLEYADPIKHYDIMHFDVKERQDSLGNLVYKKYVNKVEDLVLEYIAEYKNNLVIKETYKCNKELFDYRLYDGDSVIGIWKSRELNYQYNNEKISFKSRSEDSSYTLTTIYNDNGKPYQIWRKDYYPNKCDEKPEWKKDSYRIEERYIDYSKDNLPVQEIIHSHLSDDTSVSKFINYKYDLANKKVYVHSVETSDRETLITEDLEFPCDHEGNLILSEQEKENLYGLLQGVFESEDYYLLEMDK